jgi:hypothetical protein
MKPKESKIKKIPSKAVVTESDGTVTEFTDFIIFGQLADRKNMTVIASCGVGKLILYLRAMEIAAVKLTADELKGL